MEAGRACASNVILSGCRVRLMMKIRDSSAASLAVIAIIMITRQAGSCTCGQGAAGSGEQQGEAGSRESPVKPAQLHRFACSRPFV